MTEFTFVSRIDKVGEMPGYVGREDIHEELMLFGASPEFAGAVGGPLTKRFLKEVAPDLDQMRAFCAAFGMHIVIDTRSHMLMPGFYPAIPGWHCDAFPRGGYGEQPDLTRTTEGAHHLVAFCSDQHNGVSRTEFLAHGREVTLDVDPKAVWSSVHAQSGGWVATTTQLDGEILRFSQKTLHRAKPAHQKGWRWWVRASCFYKPPENAVRRQVQVYAPEGLGW